MYKKKNKGLKVFWRQNAAGLLVAYWLEVQEASPGNPPTLFHISLTYEDLGQVSGNKNPGTVQSCRSPELKLRI